jgi:hypothetical protein
MALPGFTAEASLYATASSYRVTRSELGRPAQDHIAPQACCELKCKRQSEGRWSWYECDCTYECPE